MNIPCDEFYTAEGIADVDTITVEGLPADIKNAVAAVQTKVGCGETAAVIGARIDEGYRTVESICLKLLLRQQPVAKDLRIIAKYFERIGDHCTNIAEWAEFSVTGTHKDCQ